jgi:hypothetical protein
MVISWEAQSQNPDNSKNFGIIANWWKSIEKKSVMWKQRVVPDSGEINWSPQKFDDTFVLTKSDVRGITFYWRKGESEDEANTTPAKLEFNPTQQHLYLYPETQKNLVISVEIPGAVRETLRMKNPAWFSEKISDEAKNETIYRLIIHDTTNLVEVEIEMDEGSLNFLKHAVNEL